MNNKKTYTVKKKNHHINLNVLRLIFCFHVMDVVASVWLNTKSFWLDSSLISFIIDIWFYLHDHNTVFKQVIFYLV